MVYGKNHLEKLINIKETIKMIRNGVMEFLNGLMEIFIKETI